MPHRTAPFQAPPLWNSLPAKDDLFARDGLRFQKTEDVLFLAQLLAKAGRRLIHETRDAHGRWCYSPHDGEAAEGLPGFVKPAAIRRKLRERLWGLRAKLSGRNIPDLSLSIDERKIRNCTRWATGEPWKLGASLRRPFSKEADPLLDSLHEIPLMSDPSLGKLAPGAKVKKGEIICPLDGIVAPIAAKICTSPESWRMLCGREWRVILCPHCLGEFHEQVTVMN